MNWMSWLRDRCLELTERVAAGIDRGPGQRWDTHHQPRGRVRGSGSEPDVMRPMSGDGRD